MNETRNEPTVFISSTVGEFRDLRSALKYTLESRGFRVWVSESDNFLVRGDTNALDECYRNIRDSDYYVLVIGTRVGALTQEGISATRSEYRVALDSFADTGRPAILAFVKEDIRRQLSDQTLKNRYPEDAEHIEGFINEVETGEGSERTQGRFLRRFRDFREIAEPVLERLSAGRNLSETLQRRALLEAISYNLSHLLGRWGRGAYPTHEWMSAVRRDIHLDLRDNFRGTVHLTRVQAIGLLSAVLQRVRPSRFRMGVIEDALSQGLFLQYDASSASYKETAIHTVLQQLLDDLDAYAQFNNTVPRDSWQENISLTDLGDSGASFPTHDLAMAYKHYDLVANVYHGLLWLAKALLGKEMEEQPLRAGSSPYGDKEGRAIRAEIVNAQEVIRLIEEEVWPYGTNILPELLGATHEERLAVFKKDIRDMGIELDEDEIDQIAEELASRMEKEAPQGIEDLRVPENDNLE